MKHLKLHHIQLNTLKDLRGEIKKVADFMNKTLSDDQLEHLAQHLHFDNFKENDKVNNEPLKNIGITLTDGHFVRKGKKISILSFAAL